MKTFLFCASQHLAENCFSLKFDSLEAEFNDFLGEEVIQALVQLSHDAVLLCLM